VPRGTDNVSDSYGQPDGVDGNINSARAIVAWRVTVGPFASIDDLYNVPAFQLETDRLIAAGNTATLLGDNPGSGKAIRFDFRQRFLLLDPASNLITTRSDTFT
jgi:hypothetical protein